MIRDILKMGDARLLQQARPVTQFNTPELRLLIDDMFDTMEHANGAGLAAPQIGVDLQVVIFGFDRNPRYPDAPTVPKTVLINPSLEPLSDEMEDGWEGCLSVPGLRGVVPRYTRLKDTGFDMMGHRIARVAEDFQARVALVREKGDRFGGFSGCRSWIACAPQR